MRCFEWNDKYQPYYNRYVVFDNNKPILVVTFEGKKIYDCIHFTIDWIEQKRSWKEIDITDVAMDIL